MKSDCGSMEPSSKYRLSMKSQEKVKDPEMSLKQLPKANEAFCMDIYKHSTASMVSGKRVDLFSGLDHTVKVTQRKF